MTSAIEQPPAEEGRQADQDCSCRERRRQCGFTPSRVCLYWTKQYTERVVPRAVRTNREHTQDGDRHMIDLGGRHTRNASRYPQRDLGDSPDEMRLGIADTMTMKQAPTFRDDAIAAVVAFATGSAAGFVVAWATGMASYLVF